MLAVPVERAITVITPVVLLTLIRILLLLETAVILVKLDFTVATCPTVMFKLVADRDRVVAEVVTVVLPVVPPVVPPVSPPPPPVLAAGLTVKVNSVTALVPNLINVNLYVPAVVGVPTSALVLASYKMPGGNPPAPLVQGPAGKVVL